MYMSNQNKNILLRGGHMALLQTFISCYKTLAIITLVLLQACQADLASVIPSLHAAITSLDSLDKADISEIR